MTKAKESRAFTLRQLNHFHEPLFGQHSLLADAAELWNINSLGVKSLVKSWGLTWHAIHQNLFVCLQVWYTNCKQETTLNELRTNRLLAAIASTGEPFFQRLFVALPTHNDPKKARHLFLGVGFLFPKVVQTPACGRESSILDQRSGADSGAHGWCSSNRSRQFTQKSFRTFTKDQPFGGCRLFSSSYWAPRPRLSTITPSPSCLPLFHWPLYFRPSGQVRVPCPCRKSLRYSPSYLEPQMFQR